MLVVGKEQAQGNLVKNKTSRENQKARYDSHDRMGGHETTRPTSYILNLLHKDTPPHPTPPSPQTDPVTTAPAIFDPGQHTHPPTPPPTCSHHAPSMQEQSARVTTPIKTCHFQERCESCGLHQERVSGDKENESSRCSYWLNLCEGEVLIYCQRAHRDVT